MVPAFEAAFGHAGRFLSFQFFRKSEVDSRQLKKEEATCYEGARLRRRPLQSPSKPRLSKPRFAVSPRLHYIHVER